jgi:hypothetical protein
MLSCRPTGTIGRFRLPSAPKQANEEAVFGLLKPAARPALDCSTPYGMTSGAWLAEGGGGRGNSLCGLPIRRRCPRAAAREGYAPYCVASFSDNLVDAGG